MMIKSLLNKYNFKWLLLVNAIFFVLAAYLLPIRFQDNDDSLMCLIASGNYSGTPDAHLVFINYFYGLIVKLFYVLLPEIEWYTVLFCLAHIVALSIIVHKIITNTNPPIIKYTFVILFYVIELVIIQSFQFTTTAALLALAGLLLIFDSRKLVVISGIILILFGSLIRFEAVVLILIVAIPMYIRRLREWKSLLLFVACLAVIFTFKLIDKEIYNQDSYWKTYIEYNELRGKINDNPNAIKLRDNYSIKEIYINDYKLLLRYFQDGQVLNNESLNRINGELNLLNIEDKISNVRQIISYSPFLVLLFVLFFITYSIQKTTFDKLIVGSGIVLFFVIMVAISMNGSLKFRVFLTAILPLFFILQNYYIPLKPITRNVFMFTLVLFIMSFLCVVTIKKINKNNEIKHVYNMQLPLLERNKAANIVPFADNFRIENTNPFKLHTLHNHLIFGGWLTNVPFNRGRFDSFKSFVDQELFLFVSKKKSDRVIPMIQTSIDNNYGIKTSVNVVDMNDEYLLVAFKTL